MLFRDLLSLVETKLSSFTITLFFIVRHEEYELVCYCSLTLDSRLTKLVQGSNHLETWQHLIHHMAAGNIMCLCNTAILPGMPIVYAIVHLVDMSRANVKSKYLLFVEIENACHHCYNYF